MQLDVQVFAGALRTSSSLAASTRPLPAGGARNAWDPQENHE